MALATKLAGAMPSLCSFPSAEVAPQSPQSHLSLGKRQVTQLSQAKSNAGGRRAGDLSCHVAMQDSMSELGPDELLSDAPLPQSEYPPGMVRYETMIVLRPDVTDEERLAFTQRYEEFLVAGGAMLVEMFNRGMQPLAYSISIKNMGGIKSRYLDGIYLLFMYVTKPESQKSWQAKLNKDDDVIRATTFRLKL